MNVGDRVLAQWPAEVGWWYPGTIVSTNGDTFEVQYDDGDRTTLNSSQIKPLQITAGSRVYGRWQAGAQYYPGKVSTAAGEAIHIDYDDGDKESTTVSMVRINQRDM
ncbi:MAG: DUF4537 domain-containing protein [Armatimonadota bacterium]|nr:DUF4537 domain-containing protein [Armatimonadota bacterium]